MKGTIKVAHWDTQNSGQAPRILGEIKGTPTIRFFKPKLKQAPGSNSKKSVTDYNGERKGVDMKRWVDYMMPSYIEEVVGGMKEFEKFESKASRNGLPQVLLFPSKDKTMPLVKFLSTEFRRKILLGEVKPSKNNKDIMDKFGVTDLPALIVIPLSSEDVPNTDQAEEEVVKTVSYADPVRYERKKEDFTRHKMHSFLSKYALKKIVIPPKKKQTTTEEKETSNLKEEKVGSTTTGSSGAKEEL